MTKNQQVRQVLIGYNIALKFGIMIFIPIFGSLVLGIFLDRKFGTTPLLILVMMVIGIVFSTYAVFRVASRLNEQAHNKEVD